MTSETKGERPPVCDYEGSDYQTSFWQMGDRDYEDQVEVLALRRLLPEQGDLLLEVGAGAGRNTPRYKGFKRIVLLDYSRTQLKQAQEYLGRGDEYIYVAADAYRLPFVPGLFDTATMIRTLHHMADAPAALQQVSQVLAKGGIFILEYANKHNLKAIIRYLLKRQSWNPFTHEPVEFAELNFDFHPQAIRDWLQEAGFSLQRQLTVSHFRIRFLKRILPLNLLVGMDSVIQPTGNWWQLTPSVFVRAQASGEKAVRKGDHFFRCPECGVYPLKEETKSLLCPGCSRQYKIRDGIYDFKDWEIDPDG